MLLEPAVVYGLKDLDDVMIYFMDLYCCLDRREVQPKVSWTEHHLFAVEVHLADHVYSAQNYLNKPLDERKSVFTPLACRCVYGKRPFILQL
jgi:hypothetical protein